MAEREDEPGAGGVEDPPLEPAPVRSARAGAGCHAGRRSRRSWCPRWIQAVVLPLAIVGAYLLLKAAGPVALIFIVAALVALLLEPVRRDAAACAVPARRRRAVRVPAR